MRLRFKVWDEQGTVPRCGGWQRRGGSLADRKPTLTMGAVRKRQRVAHFPYTGVKGCMQLRSSLPPVVRSRLQAAPRDKEARAGTPNAAGCRYRCLWWWWWCWRLPSPAGGCGCGRGPRRTAVVQRRQQGGAGGVHGEAVGPGALSTNSRAAGSRDDLEDLPAKCRIPIPPQPFSWKKRKGRRERGRQGGHYVKRMRGPPCKAWNDEATSTG